MSRRHTVVEGEHLSAIAVKYGFRDIDKIWNDGGNADLRSRRKDPNILFPGDELVIPDLETKSQSIGLDAAHQFKVKGKPLHLILVLHNEINQPIAGAPCRLELDGISADLTTDGSGKVQKVIPLSTGSGQVVTRDKKTDLDVNLQLQIGGLDPLDTRRGQVQRLNNLGYDAEDLDADGPPPPAAPMAAPAPATTTPLADEADLRFRSAVEEFQCDHGLTIDGKCGPNTQAKLKSVYGC
ncbi:MAG TPA: peptidoglycan-binding protein [Tepidisphaeraceae bacterium]|jgi:N-acetylmuramoyl-L-alanine amidase